MRKKDLVRRMTETAAGGALLCLLAPFSIPLAGGVPLTLGSFAAAFLGLFFGPRAATASVALYLALGGMGLPVFAGGQGGAGILFGPTGGFLFGFLALALLPGLFRKKHRVIGLIAGEAALYLMGTLWFVFVSKVGFWQAICACCLPFLPGDAVKCALASGLSRLLGRRLGAAPDHETKE